jgi:putative ABC transport system permease protein
MIPFLLKGLLRDRSRSLFPFLTVLSGVILTVILHSYMNGALSSMIQSTATFTTGHVRVMTHAYAKEADQIPNDLALLTVDTLLSELHHDFPSLYWTPRIKFGGILDIPDEKGETRAQAPVSGMGVDLFSAASPEWRILNIRQALVEGRLPQARGEILIADHLARRLALQVGDTATLMSSTMYGSMSVTNFVIAGTVRFGIVPMDKGTVIADLSDVQQALDMQGGAGEILGFFPDGFYHDDRASDLTVAFNARHTPGTDTTQSDADPFSPVMGTLRIQSGLADYIDLIGLYTKVVVAIFILAMSIVLWNAGLTGSLRRYGEFGVRLAIGEDKTHVYVSLLAESLMVGLIGSVIGTALGLGLSYYMQLKGLDIGAFMKDSTMMIPNVLRARITPFTAVIGFLPGLLATFLGTAMSGIGIYRRQTSELFKELEA